jgi:membrane protein YdbS with pleckstrin-like domain
MRALILRILRLSDRPAMLAAPSECFRASRRLLTLRRVSWAFHQIGAGIGLVVSLVLLRRFEDSVVAAIEGVARGSMAGLDWFLTTFDLTMVEALTAVETVAVITFPVQLIVSGVMLGLDWELRSYQVNDTAVRIREGLFRQREQTMTIANIQNMVIRQGPLQRILGISNLEIHTAGGGASSSDDDSDGHAKGLHVGRIVGIEKAEELRDRLRVSLARQRDSGLGDPDDSAGPVQHSFIGASAGLGEALDRLLEEVQALRRARQRAT